MAGLGEVNRISIPNIQGKDIFIEHCNQQRDVVITVEKKRIIVYNVSVQL